MLPKINRRDVLLLGGFLFILFAFVAIITLPSIAPIYDLSGKGGLGDALNGLTAPLIGTFGAFLIYLSFREQQTANQIQFKALQAQRKLDFVFRSHEELKSDLGRIQSDYGQRYGQPSMLDAFMQQIFRDVEEDSWYPELLEYMRYLNLQFYHLAGLLIASHHTIGKDDSHLLLSKVRYLYALYFRNYYEQLITKEWKSTLAKSFQKDVSLVWQQMLTVDQNIAYLIEQDLAAIKRSKE